jgi:predicted nucleic acid-binding protein
VIAAITASELLVGVELAGSSRAAARHVTVDAVLDAFDALPFDLASDSGGDAAVPLPIQPLL